MKNRFIILICALFLQACASPINTVVDGNAPCDGATFEFIERHSSTDDSEGHGPDIGSDEWHSVVEFRLGVRGNTSVPARGSKKWCDYIEEKLNISST